MQRSLSTEIKVHITLNQEEAEWLHLIMQNPLHGPLEHESPEDRAMREKFFNITLIRT